MNSMKIRREHKMIVVGSAGAGKSALTQMFMYGNFVEEYDPTTADSYRKMIKMGGENHQIDILDTAGQEEYMRDHYYRLGEGFLIVFAINMKDTFKDVMKFIDHIRLVKQEEKVPVIVVGSKSDLEGEREVSSQEAQSLCDKLELLYFETSAKTRWNVDEVFYELIRQVNKTKVEDEEIENKKLNKKKKKANCTIL